jgi:NAD(P)H-flavin reductase
MRLRAPSLFSFAPGQYVALTRGPERSPEKAPAERHYFSFASAPDPSGAGEFELCINAAASFNRGLEPGEEVGLEGPFGPPIVPRSGSNGALLIGTGTGVAPLRASLRAHLWPGRRVILIVGQRTEADLVFDQEFRAYPKLDYRAVLSQSGGDGLNLGGRVQAELARALGRGGLEPKALDAVVCGHSAMVDDVASLLVLAGVSQEGIFAQGYS